MKRFFLLNIFIALLAISMSSCVWLPEEPELPAAPLVRSYTPEPYLVERVTRGDIIQDHQIKVTYTPLHTESLSFIVSGEAIGSIFVSAGDTVQAGDLLIELSLGDIPEQLSEARRQLDVWRLQLTYWEENRLLALSRQEIEGQELDEQAWEIALQALKEQIDEQKQRLEAQIDIQKKKIAELESQYDQRRLLAGISGLVTSMKPIKEGDISVAREVLLEIADPTALAFRADTGFWSFFHESDPFVLTINDQEYEATVISEESLGLAPQERKEGQTAPVYFTLARPVPIFERGQTGTLTIVFDRRENVLTLPAEAVVSIGGEPIVYLETDGLQSVRKIRTGLEAGGMVEILGGLSEGDSVILAKN